MKLYLSDGDDRGDCGRGGGLAAGLRGAIAAMLLGANQLSKSACKT